MAGGTTKTAAERMKQMEDDESSNSPAGGKNTERIERLPARIEALEQRLGAVERHIATLNRLGGLLQLQQDGMNLLKAAIENHQQAIERLTTPQAAAPAD